MTKVGTKMMRRIAVVIAFVFGVALTGFAETVTNVRGSQRENSKLVDIYYDLSDSDGGTYYVEVEVVGRTSDVNASSFSGDVGEGISPGQNRRIVWDAGADWPGNKGDVKATVIAINGGKPNKIQLWEGGPYWADRNIGASQPWKYGSYLRLSGATEALNSAWGGNWRLPTERELYNLCYNKCDWTWTKMNGVNGCVVRGRGSYASNSIFLPAAGSVLNGPLHYVGEVGDYGSSDAWYRLDFNDYYGYNHDVQRAMFGDVTLIDKMSFRPVQDFATPEDATGSSEWFFVDTTDKPDVVVHFNANGGVFRDKDGNEVTQFDQYFTYGEAQRLFTDELTPMKIDAKGNANRFLGWMRGSREYSSPEDDSVLFGKRQEWTWRDDVTEETFYAVWTTTATVSFYNDTDVESGNCILSPDSLGNHLSWSVDADTRRYKSGESVQLLPGQRIIRLHVDDEYHWIAGRFDVGSYEPNFYRAYGYLELNIGNDFSDYSYYYSDYGHHIYVKVEPDINQPETHGGVVFFYSAAVREELCGLINAQRGNVPSFDISKVRISIGKTEVNQDGNVVWDLAHSLTGLELYKYYYCLPTGLYYLKDVVYDGNTSSGDPYWGAVLDSTFKNQLIEVKDGKITERTINFDVFGGSPAVRVLFDPRKGRCSKPEMWFEYYSLPNSRTGWMSIDKAMYESLPKVEDRVGFRFMGWFTEESGGIEFKSGVTISGDKVHWTLPLEHTFYAYAQWTSMTDEWVNELFPELVFDLNVDVATIAKTTAANGKLTVAQCYACGINPNDPNDDLKVTAFKMKDGKPEITLNHTEDGSGNSFLPRVRTLGKATLSDAEEWREVPEEGDPSMRFFKVNVEMP